MLQPCDLYASTKSPAQDLFTGAAALYYLTGTTGYRSDADLFYGQSNPFLFYYQWNSVVAQGVVIMSTVPYADVSGLITKAGWQDKLRAAVAETVQCKTAGSVGTYCQETPDGKLYPKVLHLLLAGHAPRIGCIKIARKVCLFVTG